MTLKVCGDRIRKKPEEALAVVRRFHAESRSRFGLPPELALSRAYEELKPNHECQGTRRLGRR